jgi:D-alanyl-D-alanine carboxypeptidase
MLPLNWEYSSIRSKIVRNMNSRKAYYLLLLILAWSGCTKSEPGLPADYACSFAFADSSGQNPNNSKYQALLDGISADGVPGIMLSVYTPEDGEWLGASGLADIAGRVPLQPCNITRTGSTVKTFTAVTIFLLAEEGLLSLDDKIEKYLPDNILDKLSNARQSTIRQLLNHSSGIYNYIRSMKFQTASVNDLTRVWHPDELLEYAYNKPAAFKCGEDVDYSNTNYVLLGMIIEKVTGEPFYQAFKTRIFEPLHLESTQFAAEDPVPANIIRGYIDFYSKLQLMESTDYSGWDYYTADGGLISTVHDLSLFMKALFSGELISESSLGEMLTWQVPKNTDPGFYPISYGLGIFKIETPYGIAYHHSGDAIGYFATMSYFTDSKTTVVWAANGNYGKIDELISSRNAMNKIFEAVMK